MKFSDEQNKAHLVSRRAERISSGGEENELLSFGIVKFLTRAQTGLLKGIRGESSVIYQKKLCGMINIICRGFLKRQVYAAVSFSRIMALFAKKVLITIGSHSLID
ncbi:hypothetical protein AVEN_26569-1 [Araneus ventricosus]|uniref:Uncharacterized protein n=1 Tax=Araneus ventricosus TaxID=182803 RepID=A0A4Y2FVM2_ARAVE|nr:hypothetical protein AVEN_26569-1 [Araneus ventricosus]